MKCTGAASQTKAKKMSALGIWAHRRVSVYREGPRAAARILLLARRCAVCTGCALAHIKAAAERVCNSPLLAVLVVHVRQHAHLPGAGNAHAPP